MSEVVFKTLAAKLAFAGALAALAGCASQPTVTTDVASGITMCWQDLPPAYIASSPGVPAWLTVSPPAATYYGPLALEQDNYGLYPGSTVYAEIGGKRWSGTERISITPEFRAALLSGGTMHVSYSPWPWGGLKAATVSLADYKGGCL